MNNNKPRPNLEMIKAACEWWGDVIVDAKQDNGDILQSNMKGLFSSMLPLVTKEMRDNFVSNLYEELVEDWNNRYYEHRGGYLIELDYGVDPILKKAVRLLPISDLKFPMKTDMIIGLNSVAVSYGYGAPWKTIAGKEAYKEN